VRTDVEERAKSTLSDAVHRCERSFVLNDAPVCTSFVVRMSGDVLRFALCRTHSIRLRSQRS
jgi:hypothetical protein